MITLVRTLNQIAQWACAVLLCLSAGRFSWVAAQPWLALLPASKSAAPAVGAPPQAPPAELPRREPLPSLNDNPHKEDPTQAPGTPSLHLMLLVSHGRERSKLSINGAFVGYTTYASDMTCTRGEILKFRIEPERGPAIERERRCEGETILVSE